MFEFVVGDRVAKRTRKASSLEDSATARIGVTDVRTSAVGRAAEEESELLGRVARNAQQVGLPGFSSADDASANR